MAKTDHKSAPEDWDLGLSPKQDREVREILSQWEAQRRRLAEHQMRLAAAAGGERRLLGQGGDNGGEVRMMIHPESYHYWGQRLGYACWQDAGFCREYLRDNPEARVRSKADELTVVVPGQGGLAASGKLKFKKTYGAAAEQAPTSNIQAPENNQAPSANPARREPSAQVQMVGQAEGTR